MDAHSAAVSVDSLLAHEQFVRGLARSLVRGDADVDDVVQETWLSAIKSPPKDEGHVRGWLATVARNVVRQRARSERRRARREEVVARPEGAPSPESLREREAVRRRLVDAVLALEPSYRDPIVLHWFDGHPVPEVARRLGLPFETVRTRLRRGLERLRDSLDARHGGDRRAWAVAFLPLAGLEPSTPPDDMPVRSSTNAAPWALAAAGVSAVGLVAFFALRSESEPVAPDKAAKAWGVAPPKRPESAVLASRGVWRAQAPAVVAPATTELKGSIRARVRDAMGTPVPGVAYQLMEATAGVPQGLAMGPVSCGAGHRQGVSDAYGEIALDGVIVGAYQLTAWTSDGRRRATATVGASTQPSPVVLTLAAEDLERPALRVRVLDDHRLPVAGARVDVKTASGESLVGTTAHEGDVSFAPVASGSVVVTARRGSQAGQAAVQVGPRSSDGNGAPVVSVVLGDVGAITGNVRASDGAPVARSRVRAVLSEDRHFANTLVEHEGRVGPDGTYRIADLPAGDYAILVDAPPGLRLDTPSDWTMLGRDGRRYGDEPVLRAASVAAGATVTLDLVLVPGVAFRGTVVRASDRAPVAGAVVRARRGFLDEGGPRDVMFDRSRRGPAAGRSDDRPLSIATTMTDAAGRYELAGLASDERYTVEVVAFGLGFDRREVVVPEGERKPTLEHELEDAGTLEILFDTPHAFALRRRGSEQAIVRWDDASSTAGPVVKVPGLPVGEWELCCDDGTGTPRVVAAAKIEADRTTVVDLSTIVNTEISIRFTAGGQPLVGADVSPWRTSLHATTDPSGVATLRSAWPLRSNWIEVKSPERDAVPVLYAWPEAPPSGPETPLSIECGSSTLTVSVVAHDGSVVPRAVVALTTIEGDVSARRTADGNGVVRWAGLPATGYLAVASAPGVGHGWDILKLDRSKPRDVQIRLRPSGSLRVVTRDTEGRPRPDVRVVVAGAEYQVRISGVGTVFAPILPLERATTGIGGEVTLNGLPEGDVDVYVPDDDALRSAKVVAGSTVDLVVEK